MRSLGFKVVDEFSHDRARSEQRIAAEIYAIIRYFTYRQLFDAMFCVKDDGCFTLATYEN